MYKRVAILTVFGIVALILVLWPASYTSTAKFQLRVIEPDPLASRQLTTQDLSQHFERWKQLAFTDDNLRGLIRKYKLYSAESIDRSLASVRRDMIVKTLKDTSDPKLRQAGVACCYEIGFGYTDPNIDLTVTQDVCALFLVEAWQYNKTHFRMPPPCKGDCEGTGLRLVEPPNIPRRSNPLAHLFTGLARYAQ